MLQLNLYSIVFAASFLCPLTGLPAPPAFAGCRVAQFGRGECDGLRVQVVHQLGSTQADPCCLKLRLELRQDQRLVLQDLTVQCGVGQDEGAHRLKTILQTRCHLGGRNAAIVV